MSIRNITIMLVILLALGGVYYFSSRPKPAEPEEPQIYVWMIEMDEIEHIKIELPRQGVSQAFIKIPQGDQFPWFFDDSQHSDIDQDRWGGGIPLLLSGPGVDRVLYEDASEEKLAELGLIDPRMKITLTLEGEKILNIIVGDETPNGQNFYIKAPNSNDVATVDISWYDVIERLVTDPPYAST